jgi:hypothetical protein
MKFHINDRQLFGIQIFIFGLIFVAVGVIGYLYSSDARELNGQEEKQGVSSIATSSPMATSIPRESPKLSILNASGVVGAAAKFAEQVKSQGYEVVEIGNAPKIQSGNTLFAADNVLEINDSLVKILKVGEISALLEGNLSYNVQVVLGK